MADVRQIKLPTAEDGEVVYQIDAVTKKPMGAKDDRAEIVNVSLNVMPKLAATRPEFFFVYGIMFKGGATPRSIAVYAEEGKALTLELKDAAPTLRGDTYTAMVAPKGMDEAAWKRMASEPTLILQKKFVIIYADGEERTLHQLAVLTNTVRLVQQAGAAANAPVRAPASPVEFDARTWTVGFDQGARREHITEYVLPGQTVDAWRELFTHQELQDADAPVRIDKLLARVKELHARDCPSLDWQVLRLADAEAVYQWSHDGCRGNPAQYEIVRLTRTGKGLCRWAYTSKDMPIANARKNALGPMLDKLACE
jgi:hypothetical protein